jgi:lipase maturation factor 1
VFPGSRAGRAHGAVAGPTGLARPLLVWDGDCGFCRRWAEWLGRRSGGLLDLEPYQQVRERFTPFSSSDYARAVHLVAPGGRVYVGAAAVLHALALTSRTAEVAARVYERVPAVAFVLEALYGFMARHRARLSFLAPSGVASPRDESQGEGPEKRG